MEKSCLISIVISLKDGKRINDTLDTIFTSEALHEIEKLQVLVVSGSMTVSEMKQCIKQEYFHMVELYQGVSSDIAHIYEIVKLQIRGIFVNFITEYMYYSQETVAFVLKILHEKKNRKMYSIRPVFMDKGEEKKYPIAPKKNGKYDVWSEDWNMQLYFSAYFMKKEILDEFGFDSDITLTQEKEKDFLMRYFAKYGTYVFNSTKKLYFLDAAENEPASNLLQFEKAWYLSDMEQFVKKWAEYTAQAEDRKKYFVQSMVLYSLYSRYNCNSNDRNKKVLNEEELARFEQISTEILKYIPERVILASDHSYTVAKSLQFFFLRMRKKVLGEDYCVRVREGTFYLENKNDAPYSIAPVDDEKIVIAAINYQNDVIKIDFRTALMFYLEEDEIQIKVLCNGKPAELTEVHCYPLIKMFGKTVFRKKQYQVTIPVPVRKKEELEIEFYAVINGVDYKQPLTFTGAASKLMRKYEAGYWQFAPNKILFCEGVNRLHVKNITIWTLWNYEKKFKKNIEQYLEEHPKNIAAKEMYDLRLQYLKEKYQKHKKRIWIMFDKLYKAGDNGEYMYHYLKNHDLGIEPWYILNEDSPDYARLKEAGANLLITNSDECRLKCLMAEVILATHVSVWTYCGFDKKQQEHIRDLFQAKIVCIQHGLTVQKIAQYQNRLFDNTQFYCCASKYEVKNILQPIYGYDTQDVVLAGLARYDGLKNADKKQILITPTWRRELVNTGIASEKKAYNEHFKNSAFFEVYNSLINNEKLIASAKKNGYHLIYLLHPALSPQSVDFTVNDSVTMLEASGDMSYEKILTESSLMITDYSGVQFDFAYMRKPIVYYHPSMLPPFYEEGVFVYETMGFGEICTEENELADMLCEYMDHGCVCKPFYVERADEFFAFDDYNSCERIYKEVDKFLKR